MEEDKRKEEIATNLFGGRMERNNKKPGHKLFPAPAKVNKEQIRP